MAEEYLRELNSDAQLAVYGQELNPEAHGICKSDMLIKGQNPENIIFGNRVCAVNDKGRDAAGHGVIGLCGNPNRKIARNLGDYAAGIRAVVRADAADQAGG